MTMPHVTEGNDSFPHTKVYDFKLRTDMGEPPPIWRHLSTIAGTALVALVAAVALL